MSCVVPIPMSSRVRSTCTRSTCTRPACTRSLHAIAALSLAVALAACGGSAGGGVKAGDAKSSGGSSGGPPSGAGGRPGGSPGGGPGGERPTAVTTVRLQTQRFADRYTAIGTVKARESVTVTAKVSEIVQQVHFDSGDSVRAGAPLVTLSQQQQQAALAEAQAAADEAERLYRRQRELAGQQLIASAQLDNQRAARDAANARVGQIRAQLAERVIRAPFAGVLGLRQVSPGALVTPGTAIATLDALDRVYVDFPLPESQLARASAGLRVFGKVVAYPDRAFEGAVTTVDTRLDPVARAALVRADFANADRILRPGMLVNIELSGSERDALMVPEIAVVQVGRDSFVYRVKTDDSVEQIKVVVAARGGGRVELAGGVAVGDRIVVEGTGKLRPGAKISEGGAGASAKPAVGRS
jgi:membrane fusion protein, multidrug efflux system